MAKETIRFKGLSLNRDEQSAEHGELALCAGVELHDGALRPSVLQGSTVTHKETVGGEEVDVPSTFQVKVSGVDTPVTLLYVHETPAYRHFVCSLGGKLYWFKSDGTVGSPLESGSHTPIHDFSSDIISVQSVGNTMIVMIESGVNYVLWKSDTLGYKYIGDQIPFLDLKFRPSDQYDNYSLSDLTSTIISEYAWDIWEGTSSDQKTKSWPFGTEIGIKESYRASICEGIKALVNKINHEITERGHFYAPFIIRYCYRLYDGSMTMHSAPVLLNVSTPQSYRVYATNLEHSGALGDVDNLGGNIAVTENGSSVAINGFGIVYKPNEISIRYSTIGTDANNDILTSLKEDWSDIVDTIDIFISPMMSREKIDELPEFARPETPNWGVRDGSEEQFPSELVATFDGGSGKVDYEINIPLFTEDEYLQRLRDCSNFFMIKSFNVKTDNIGTDGSFTDLDVDKSVVKTITSQEQMTRDDYHTHNTLMPINVDSGMYTYNHRLNLYGMQEKLFEGFHILTNVNDASGGVGIRVNEIVVELSTEQGIRYVSKKYAYPGVLVTQTALRKALLFYPDRRAVKMYIKYENGLMITLPMEPCNFLNGAMSTSMFFSSWPTDIDIARNFPDNMNVDLMPNKILSSEADDPYFFPVEGRNSVGNGVIKGVAAVTRALSQGQVGDHDLMVFSTDGIWALKVSSEGTYMAMHNISREVCSNQKSICQLDQSVLFATERNLVQLWESDMRSLSEVLDGPVPDWQHVLPSLYAAFPANGTEAQQVIHRLLEQGTPAVTMFNKGRLFYDHASARVVVLPEDTSHESVAMVYSLRDEAWSTMPIPAIKAVVPGYPSPFVQLGDSTVMILDKPYDYAGGEEVAAVPGLIITRTLTFSDTMDVIRGYTQYGDSTLASTLFIYGSNDQRNWQALGTTSRWFYNYLPGKPFRFFRIAIYLQMKPSEEYQQLEVEVVNKYAKL